MDSKFLFVFSHCNNVTSLRIFRAVQFNSEKCNLNPNPVWIKQMRKRFLCVYTEAVLRVTETHILGTVDLLPDTAREIETFDLQFDLHLLSQAATLIGSNKSREYISLFI